MREVFVSDITVKRSGEKKAFSLSFREKIETAKLLDKLGVSVIEVPGVARVKVDSLLIKSISSAVKESVVAVPVTFEPENLEQVWSALREAAHPRLQVPAPVSPVQMEYLYHKKPDAMKKEVCDTLRRCRALCADVEFIALDATRSDGEFLREILTEAVECGAAAVTVCNSSGTMLPDAFGAFVGDLIKTVPALSRVRLGVACSNELSMADACAVEALRSGASEVKACAYGGDMTSLQNITKVLHICGDELNAKTAVRNTELNRIISQISWLCETNRSKTSPFDNGVQEDAGATLNAHDTIETLQRVLTAQGYDLPEEDLTRVYDAFQRIATRKETVGMRELDAIVAAAAMQVPPTYKLESYVINSGNIITATAHLRLKKGDTVLSGISVGDGPVDAAFLALEQIAGCHYELDDFQIQAVTEGREAMGEAIVKLRSLGKVYSGRGISTDVVGATIYAYLNALNKIVYEEESE